MKFMFAAVMVALSLALVVDGTNLAGEKKIETKEVMKKAMKGGLAKKVGEGKASDAEKKELVQLFTALAANTPAKGNADNWKKQTAVLVEAAKKSAAGDADGQKALLAATNGAACAACHKEFKGK
jgi:cytochrome c556